MPDVPDCCPVRRYFILAIIGHRTDVPTPVDIADHVIQWEPQIIVRTSFCPFCGKRIEEGEQRNTSFVRPNRD